MIATRKGTYSRRMYKRNPEAVPVFREGLREEKARKLLQDQGMLIPTVYARAPTLFLHLHIRFLARATEIRDKIRLNTTTGQFTSTYATFSALPQLPTLGHPCSIILWLSKCTCSSSVCSNTSRPCSPRMTRAYNDLSDPPFAMHNFLYQCN